MSDSLGEYSDFETSSFESTSTTELGESEVTSVDDPIGEVGRMKYSRSGKGRNKALLTWTGITLIILVVVLAFLAGIVVRSSGERFFHDIFNQENGLFAFGDDEYGMNCKKLEKVNIEELVTESMNDVKEYRKLNLVYPFSSDEYICTGSCFCETGQLVGEEYFNLRRSTQRVLSRGLTFVVAAITSITAVGVARKEFNNECQSSFKGNCPQESIYAEVEDCQILTTTSSDTFLFEEEKKDDFVENSSPDLHYSSSFSSEESLIRPLSDEDIFAIFFEATSQFIQKLHYGCEVSKHSDTPFEDFLVFFSKEKAEFIVDVEEGVVETVIMKRNNYSGETGNTGFLEGVTDFITTMKKIMGPTGIAAFYMLAILLVERTLELVQSMVDKHEEIDLKFEELKNSFLQDSLTMVGQGYCKIGENSLYYGYKDVKTVFCADYLPLGEDNLPLYESYWSMLKIGGQNRLQNDIICPDDEKNTNGVPTTYEELRKCVLPTITDTLRLVCRFEEGGKLIDDTVTIFEKRGAVVFKSCFRSLLMITKENDDEFLRH